MVADEHGPAGESRGSRDDQIVETIARSFCTTLRPAHGRLRGEVLDGMEELAKCHAAIALVVPGVPVQSVPVRRKKTTIARTESAYHAVLADMVRLIREARRASARAVNTVMTATYWEIGRRIVGHEQGGEARAGYGGALLALVSEDLTKRFGRDFSVDRFETARLFYLAYPDRQISATTSRKLPAEKSATLSRKSPTSRSGLHEPARLPLSWSHYVLLRHADAGQMHMYLNYAREHWMVPGENPPVGLILCTSKEDAVVRCALEGLSNKVLAAEYRTALPDERLIAAALTKTRRQLEARQAIKPSRRRR